MTDLGCGFGPEEGFWVFVPGFGVAQDCPLERADAVEGSSPDSFLGDAGEPSLDKVEPRGVGGRQGRWKRGC